MSMVDMIRLPARSIRVTVPSAAVTHAESASRATAVGRAASWMGAARVTPVTGSSWLTDAPSSLTTQTALRRRRARSGLAPTPVVLADLAGLGIDRDDRAVSGVGHP